jgi:tetratricopeptide (TPR) repeat protein
MLAYHYSNGGESAQAVHYLKLSGDKAVKTHSLMEAFRFYEDAHGILKQTERTVQNKRKRVEVILSMAIPMRFLAFPENSVSLLQEGEAFCRDLGDQRSWALVHSYLGMFHSTKGGDAPLGMRYQQEAFDAAEKLQDGKLMSQTGGNLCFAYDYAGEYRLIAKTAPKVIDLLEKMPEKIEFLDAPVDLHPVLLALYGHALSYLGEFAQGEEECEKALVLAQQDDNPYSLGMVEFLYGCQYIPRGDGEKAVIHLKKSVGYLEKLRAVSVLHVAWSLLAMAYDLLGESEEASGYFQRVLEVQKTIKSPGFLSLGHYALSSVLLNSNDLEEARVHAEKALNLAQRNHEKYCEALAWIQLGRVIGRAEGTKMEEPEEYISKGLKTLEDLELMPAYAMGCFSLCELYLNAGKIEKGLEVLRRSEEMFSQMGMDHWLAKAREVTAKMHSNPTK